MGPFVCPECNEQVEYERDLVRVLAGAEVAPRAPRGPVFLYCPNNHRHGYPLGQQDATPKVDSQYWFDYSKALVDAALTKCDAAAEKLQKLAVWLWTTYTAAAAIGFALSDKSLPLDATALIVAASAALVGVYWATVWVQMPVPQAFDPRAPAEIRVAHADAVKRKTCRLRWTLRLSAFAAFLVALAIAVASVVEPVAADPPLPEYALSTDFAEGAEGQRKLLLTTTLEGAKRVRVRLFNGPGEPTSPGWEDLIPLTGLIQTELPVPDAREGDLRLQVEWADPTGLTIRLEKKLSGQGAPDAASAIESRQRAPR